MSRLRSRPAAAVESRVQPEVIGLVHDQVVSLCHRLYSSISGIEIDGLICISLLDTKEQQVVKIHKTLKSVVADVAAAAARKSASSSGGSASAKKRAYPKIASILSAGSPGGQEKVDVGGEMGPNFQKDISTLNDILQASNAIIQAEAERAVENQTESLESRRSKRKRKHPKQRLDAVYDAENEDSSQGAQDAAALATSQATFGDQEHVMDQSNTRDHAVVSAGENIGGVANVTVTVKEEPADTGYENVAMDTTNTPAFPEVSDVVSSSNNANTDNNDNAIPPENNDIDFEIREQRHSRSESVEETHEPFEEQVNEDGTVDLRFKSENTSQDEEYGIVVNQQPSTAGEAESNQNNDANATTENPNTSEKASEYDRLKQTLEKSQEAEKHWLYGIGRKPGDVEGGEGAPGELASMDSAIRTALLEKYQQKGSLAHQGLPREIRGQEKDPQGRSWIEMVKDNVTKYQAALMRSVKKPSPGPGAQPPEPEPAAGSASGLLKSLATPRTSSLLNADNLKALLKEPPLQLGQGVGGRLVGEAGRDVRDKSLTLNTNSSTGSDRSRSASVSPAPVVKIEIDDDGQSYNDLPGHAGGHPMYTPAGDQPGENMGEGEKPPSGKLESRYPALFNQLQQAKKSGDTTSLDSSESLVNRLPFISFQELFASASPGAPSPRMTDTITNMLQQAKQPPAGGDMRCVPPKKKSVWKWKKRLVKNKNIDTGAKTGGSGSPDKATNKQLGMNMSAKKTFSKKRSKDTDSSDTEWTPAEAADEDVKESSGDNTEAGARKKIKTRLSTGDKQRISFADIDNSDIELEEDFQEEQAEPIELVSAFCRNNCGMRCESLLELRIHEDHCTWGSAMAVIGAAGLPDDEPASAPGPELEPEPMPVPAGPPVGVVGPTTTTGGPAGTGAGSGGGAIAAGSLSGAEGVGVSGEKDNYKCTMCGLDFNQEYRWHYHMVKSHGVSAEETPLFR